MVLSEVGTLGVVGVWEEVRSASSGTARTQDGARPGLQLQCLLHDERLLGHEQHDLLSQTEVASHGPGDPSEDRAHPGADPVLHHHHHRLHRQPARGLRGHPQQEHDEHNQSLDPQPSGEKNVLRISADALYYITSF